MKRSTSLLIQIALLLIGVGFSIVISAKLPEVVPIHWNAAGTPDGYGGKNVTLWLMPGMTVFIMLLLAVIPSISPKNFSIQRFGDVYWLICVAVVGLFTFLHLVIGYSTIGALHNPSAPTPNFNRFLFAGIFLFFALIGNQFGKIKPNFFVGIRTPWTLSDPRVWAKTHREAGWYWVIGGLLGTITSLAGAPVTFSIGLMLILALVPVARSYFIWKKVDPQP